MMDRPLRILVADDDPQVTNSVSGILNQLFPCQVVTCADGNEVLLKMGQETYDILITDMLMPGCHGIELIQKVKELSPSCDVVVLTAYPNDFPYLEAVKAGASDFVTKPYPMEEIGARLLRLVRERTQRMEKLRGNDLDTQGDSVNKRYGLLFEQNMNGMIVLNPNNHIIIDANSSACELFGRKRDELLGSNFLKWLTPADSERFLYALKWIQNNKRGTLADIKITHQNEKEVWLDATISVINSNEDIFILLVFTDVTEKRQTTDRLAELATTDALTGLFNYRTFCIWLEGSVATAIKDKIPLALIFIDVDNFKKCNDTYGHQTGDQLLQNLGDIIRSCIRVQDRAFRYGGDEFAIIVHGNVVAATKIAERMRDKFSLNQTFGTSLSFGVAEHKDGMDAKALVQAADQALYKAKAAGKNAIVDAEAV